ncbi:suppressor of cytokine signaling 3-like [Protopterus annectens]|uniref:suppressor of cytokine signaling 3-like n=1 Tax=Protopterus annectens TaxID=7888 RepID=UPI001CFAD4C5|nr:suppressor of cytokine signaling 3-like [Protopterus annectens]
MVTFRRSHPCCFCFHVMPLPSDKPSYHYKLFCGEYECIENAIKRLEASGFYWSTLPGAEAKRLLTMQPVGAFLVRDSSDHRHLFTLSVRTEAGITNLRIKQKDCLFYLETDPGTEKPHTFDCVVKLVDHYASQATDGLSEVTFCYTEGKECTVPLILNKPLNCRVVTLQDLCKRTIVRNLQPRASGSGSEIVEGLPVPKTMKDALKN